MPLLNAVVGCHDDMKGQLPVGFVVLKPNHTNEEDKISVELVAKVRDTIGELQL